MEKRGLLILTPEERSGSSIEITCSVVTPPRSPYLNVKTNPPRGFYGYATIFVGAYVLEEVEIQFEEQVIFRRENDLLQIAALIECLNLSVQASLITFSGTFNPAVRDGELQLTVPIPPAVYGCPVTAVKFVFPEGVQAVIKLLDRTLYFCGASSPDILLDEPEAPPENTDNELPLSPPYNPQTNDDNDTYVRESVLGASGTWSFDLQNGGLRAIVNVPGFAEDDPFMTLAVPIGTTPVTCPDAPCLYLVSSADMRNMFPPANFTQDANPTFFHSKTFIPA